MSIPRTVVFDLGGTLVDWPDWDGDAPRRWGLSFDHVADVVGVDGLPERERYVEAMRAAELAHWRRVEAEGWSGPPTSLLRDGFARLGVPAHERELLAALDGYARAVDGWAVAFPDARATLATLRERGYRIGLLSNTWWAADWHNADLAAHDLADLLDAIVYTSDLPHSKPHPSVFAHVLGRLGSSPEEGVMVGDRMVDDISGALAVGMRGVWRENDNPWPKPEGLQPSATIRNLDELPELLRGWGGE